jgi:hypothetical protein
MQHALEPLQRLSARPSLVVDPWGFRLWDPGTNTHVGYPGPWGRERVVVALPFLNGPRRVRAPSSIGDPWRFCLYDPGTHTLVGREGITVTRMLDARWVGDTRRL